MLGSVETHDTLCRKLAREADAAVVSVDYRLHGAQVGVDASRLAVGGDSSGANLALVVLNRRCEALRTALLFSVTALLLGNMFLAEPIPVYEIAGAATIGLGLLSIDGRLPRRVMRVISERLAVRGRR